MTIFNTLTNGGYGQLLDAYDFMYDKIHVMKPSNGFIEQQQKRFYDRCGIDPPDSIDIAHIVDGTSAILFPKSKNF